MNRSTTGKGTKSKLVWHDELDDREFDATGWDFELCNNLFKAECQRLINHYCKAARA